MSEVQYFIRNRTNPSTATVDFFISFPHDDGFIDYLIERKGLKSQFNALTVSASKKNKTLKITMPFGVNEKQFNEKAKRILQFLYNWFSMNYYANCGNDAVQNFADILFGGNKT